MRKGGIGKAIGGIVWLLVIIGVILAVFQQTGIISIDEALNTAKNTAAHYAECIPSGECGLLSILRDIKPSELIINPGGNNGEQSEPNGPNSYNGPSNPNAPGDNNSDLIFDMDYEEMRLTRDTKGYRGPEKGEAYVNEVGIIKKDIAKQMLETVPIKEPNEEADKEIKYSRLEWKHWTKEDGSCLTTRDEILFRDVKPNTIKFLNSKLQPTEIIDEACIVGFIEEIDGKRKINTENSGEWIDPYSGKLITSSSELDIDHVVPLSYAAKHGGQEWTLEQKEKFANDKDNLLATSAKENRSKGDKGPDKYMPSASYRCQYAKTFTSVIYKYGLKITESDFKALEKALRICQY